MSDLLFWIGVITIFCLVVYIIYLKSELDNAWVTLSSERSNHEKTFQRLESAKFTNKSLKKKLENITQEKSQLLKKEKQFEHNIQTKQALLSTETSIKEKLINQLDNLNTTHINDVQRLDTFIKHHLNRINELELELHQIKTLYQAETQRNLQTEYQHITDSLEQLSVLEQKLTALNKTA